MKSNTVDYGLCPGFYIKPHTLLCTFTTPSLVFISPILKLWKLELADNPGTGGRGQAGL